MLLHTQIAPVLYLIWPDAESRGREASAARRHLAESRRPFRDMGRFLEDHAGDTALVRDALLIEGYVFAERPAIARAIATRARVEHLFDAPQVYRARDGRVEVLERVADGYVDEAGSGAPPPERSTRLASLRSPLGLDLEAVRAQTGALRTLPIAMNARWAAFELVFPDDARRAGLVELRDGATEVVSVGGDRATLLCSRRRRRRSALATRHPHATPRPARRKARLRPGGRLLDAPRARGRSEPEARVARSDQRQGARNESQ